jgi:transcriptional regulator with XRE-family HTH domain
MTVAIHPPPMPGSESVATLGARRSGLLRQRLSTELVSSRLNGGLSLREVARRIGISVDRLKRAERGEPNVLTIDLVARIAPVVGLQLAASLYPNGDPLRDRAHLALLERFRSRLHPSLSWRTEVPMPTAGDMRGADGVIEGGFGIILLEAETRLTDLQAVERKASLKKRDLGADRLILLIADTPNNRRVLDLHPELRERFPIGTRKCLAAVARGADPGGDCLVVL